MNFHLDIAPIPDCQSLDSYGMICLKCNECGRFNELHCFYCGRKFKTQKGLKIHISKKHKVKK